MITRYKEKETNTCNIYIYTIYTDCMQIIISKLLAKKQPKNWYILDSTKRLLSHFVRVECIDKDFQKEYCLRPATLKALLIKSGVQICLPERDDFWVSNIVESMLLELKKTENNSSESLDLYNKFMANMVANNLFFNERVYIPSPKLPPYNIPKYITDYYIKHRLDFTGNYESCHLYSINLTNLEAEYHEIWSLESSDADYYMALTKDYAFKLRYANRAFNKEALKERINNMSFCALYDYVHSKNMYIVLDKRNDDFVKEYIEDIVYRYYDLRTEKTKDEAERLALNYMKKEFTEGLIHEYK